MFRLARLSAALKSPLRIARARDTVLSRRPKERRVSCSALPD